MQQKLPTSPTATMHVTNDWCPVYWLHPLGTWCTLHVHYASACIWLLSFRVVCSKLIYVSVSGLRSFCSLLFSFALALWVKTPHFMSSFWLTFPYFTWNILESRRLAGVWGCSECGSQCWMLWTAHHRLPHVLWQAFACFLLCVPATFPF